MKRRIGTTIAAALLAWQVVLPTGTASAAVSSDPPATPQIGGSRTSGSDGTIEVVRQITRCGNVMYAVGSFTHVRNPNSSTPVARNNAFAFRATAPHTINNWNPNVNGQVDMVACGTDGSVFLGGTFSTAGGTANRNLAKVNAVTGASMSFAFHPAGRVAHMEVVQPRAAEFHLLVGGYFAGLLASVNPVTGADDHYIDNALPITGTYQYPGVSGHARRIWNMTPDAYPWGVAPNPMATAVLMTGVFTSVGGQRHEQVFRLNLTPGRATVSNWTPTELFAHCIGRQPFYAQDAAFSADGSRIFVATTGLRLYDEPRTTRVRTGPCDATIAYPATERVFDGHLWINYTGCDSLFSIAADATTVYAGGHQKSVSNGQVCGGDRPGPGGIAQPGLAEYDPATGQHQPGPNRGRGLGAADLLRTPTGLWVASDNQANTDSCAGRHNRMGICLLPN
jgi:hypothetical protein